MGDAVGDRIDIFNPTPPQAQLLLDLLQRADCSLEDIAQALRTSVSALTVYLASDDAIEIFAQAELANARRGRLAATAQLDKCAHALSLILDGYISDTTIAVRRDTPKTRREDLIHQESARRAATQLFKIVNFTPRVFTAALNSPSLGGAREGAREGAGGGFSASEHSSTSPCAASPARLLSPHQRDVGAEVPESRLEDGRAVRGRDATELQPASINAQPHATSDALNAPSPGGGRAGFAEGRIVPQPSLPTLTTPKRPPQTPTASSRHTSQPASPAATVPP